MSFLFQKELPVDGKEARRSATPRVTDAEGEFLHTLPDA